MFLFKAVMVEFSFQLSSEPSLEFTSSSEDSWGGVGVGGEGSLPLTVLPIILLPCLKGPVGLMISYHLVDIFTQEEDEW